MKKTNNVHRTWWLLKRVVDLFKFLKVKFRNGNTMGCRIGAVMFDQSVFNHHSMHSHLPCLCVDFTHHTVKHTVPVLGNVVEGLDMTIVHIEVRVR